jgi:hypothetical protein
VPEIITGWLHHLPACPAPTVRPTRRRSGITSASSQAMTATLPHRADAGPVGPTLLISGHSIGHELLCTDASDAQSITCGAGRSLQRRLWRRQHSDYGSDDHVVGKGMRVCGFGNVPWSRSVVRARGDEWVSGRLKTDPQGRGGIPGAER